MSILDLPVFIMACPHMAVAVPPANEQILRDTVTLNCQYCGEVGFDDRRLRS